MLSCLLANLFAELQTSTIILRAATEFGARVQYVLTMTAMMILRRSQATSVRRRHRVASMLYTMLATRRHRYAVIGVIAIVARRPAIRLN